MYKILISLISSVFIVMCILSCKEYDALEYKDDPALYFVNDKYGQRDSLDHSFFLVPGEEPDTVYVELHTMGYLSDIDRPFVLEQVNRNDPDAAVPGVHYVAFDDPAVSGYFVIPANKAIVKLPVIFLRDESLKSTKVRLVLKVVQNNYFRPGIPKWTSFVLKTTAAAVKPSLWDTSWKYRFGASWGPVKMKFIMDVTGYTDWEYYPSDSGFLNYMSTKVLLKFQEYNEANPDNPLKEADGKLVSFTD